MSSDLSGRAFRRDQQFSVSGVLKVHTNPNDSRVEPCSVWAITGLIGTSCAATRDQSLTTGQPSALVVSAEGEPRRHRSPCSLPGGCLGTPVSGPSLKGIDTFRRDLRESTRLGNRTRCGTLGDSMSVPFSDGMSPSFRKPLPNDVNERRWNFPGVTLVVGKKRGQNTAVVSGVTARGDRFQTAGAGLVSGNDRVTNVVSDRTIARPQPRQLIQQEEFPHMTRGNRNLGIVELVESLEDLLPMLRRLAYADGQITKEEEDLITFATAITTGASGLAHRTQIATSLIRGLTEPPARADDLMEQYAIAYGPKAIGAD